MEEYPTGKIQSKSGTRHIIKIKMHSSCEIEGFVETHFCKLCVILRSRVLRVMCPHYDIYHTQLKHIMHPPKMEAKEIESQSTHVCQAHTGTYISTKGLPSGSCYDGAFLTAIIKHVYIYNHLLRAPTACISVGRRNSIQVDGGRNRVVRS